MYFCRFLKGLQNVRKAFNDEILNVFSKVATRVLTVFAGFVKGKQKKESMMSSERILKLFQTFSICF